MPNIAESNKHTDNVDQAVSPSIDGLIIILKKILCKVMVSFLFQDDKSQLQE